MSVFERITVYPSEVKAGETVEFVLTLIVSDDYTQGPSRIVFDLPTLVGTSRPSLIHFEDLGFIRVQVSNPHVEYTSGIWDIEASDFAVPGGKQSWRAVASRMAVVDLDGGLTAGDVIEFHWGDTGGGYGAGTHVSHVVPKPDYDSVIHVRYFDNQNDGLPDYSRSFAGYERPAPTEVVPVIFRVRPQAPARLRLLRQHNRALLLPLDRYWNVADVADATTLVESDSEPIRNDQGTFTFQDRNVTVRSRGLPLTESPPMHDVFDGYHIYWGDIHNHSAISIDCIEREKMDLYPDDLMTYARERAGLDFYAVSDHHQPVDPPRYHLKPEEWQMTMDAVAKHHKPGEFVVFPASEFRCKRGDTVILFNWMPEFDELDHPTGEDIRSVWRKYEGRDYLTIPHFHNPGRMPDGEWWTAGEHYEPVLEIFSCHGSYERPDALERKIPLIKSRRPDRFGSWFLQQGYRYGFVGNSDGHKGHVGTNGITAVFARSLDRDSIIEAYRQRRVYASTNARIRLLFTANGHLMGSVIPNETRKTFMIDVIGENNLKKIDVFRNGTHYQRLIPDGKSFKTEFTVNDDEPSFWYVRVTQVDDHIAYASPVWFE